MPDFMLLKVGRTRTPSTRPVDFAPTPSRTPTMPSFAQTTPGQIVPYGQSPPATAPSGTSSTAAIEPKPMAPGNYQADYVDADWSETVYVSPTRRPPRGGGYSSSGSIENAPSRIPQRMPYGGGSAAGNEPGAGDIALDYMIPSPPQDVAGIPMSPGDYEAYQQGASPQSLSEDRRAYDYIESGFSAGAKWVADKLGIPHRPEDVAAANRYRRRNGLPEIDDFGKEIPFIPHPASPSRGDYQPNPFNTSSPVDSPYDFSVDPETGKPWDPSVSDAARERGVPPWHIDPSTGLPWGEGDPNAPTTPFPNPFGSAPGGAFRYPPAESKTVLVGYSWKVSVWYDAGKSWDTTFISGPKGEYSTASKGPGNLTAYVDGKEIASWGNQQTLPYKPYFVVDYKTPIYGTEFDFSGNPEAIPLGDPPPQFTPSPNGQQPASDRGPGTSPKTPRPQFPAPTQPNPRRDPNPSRPTAPAPYPDMAPNRPLSPAPAPAPTPYLPGQRQPSYNPSADPAPSRPTNPGNWTGTGTITSTGGGSTTGTGAETTSPPTCRYAVDRQVSADLKVFKKCGPDGPEFETIAIQVHFAMKESVEAQFAKLAEIEAQKCDPCYIAMPESAQLKIVGNFPQLVVQYAEILPSGKLGAPKYSVSIPHYRFTRQQTQASLFPGYKKGQFAGILVLPDNSKIVVNAESEAVASATVEALSLCVPPAMRQQAIVSITQRKGRTLSKINVAPKICNYYATGKLSDPPNWRLYLDGP